MLTRIINRFSSVPRGQRWPRILRKYAQKWLWRQCRGILHIGAHHGGEAPGYRSKNVIFIEANPALMDSLNQSIAPYPNQRAYCVLLGDRNEEVDFHIANNYGASSSIFKLGPFSEGSSSLWSGYDLRMVETIRLKMRTLDDFVAEYGIDLSGFDTWNLDVQGAELLVLDGAKESLRHCKTITTEISTVEVYKNGVLYDTLREKLAALGFAPLIGPRTLSMKHGDITFVHESVGAPVFKALRFPMGQYAD